MVRKTVMVFGTFDLLHPGHRFVMEEAGKRGHVTVIVARDANVRRIKNRVPKQGESERTEAIRTAFPDYDVQLGDPDDFLVPVRKKKPDIILLGYDQCLPPGVSEDLLSCTLERLPPYKPEKFKSSILG